MGVHWHARPPVGPVRIDIQPNPLRRILPSFGTEARNQENGMNAVSPRRWQALIVLAAAQFMVIMDTSIIGVALPDMQRDLGFTPAACSGCSTPTSSPSAACCCSAGGCRTCSAPARSSAPAGSS
nr:hypothetical protein GCM10020093_031800 [Planobispora longispora]